MIETQQNPSSFSSRSPSYHPHLHGAKVWTTFPARNNTTLQFPRQFPRTRCQHGPLSPRSLSFNPPSPQRQARSNGSTQISALHNPAYLFQPHNPSTLSTPSLLAFSSTLRHLEAVHASSSEMPSNPPISHQPHPASPASATIQLYNIRLAASWSHDETSLRRGSTKCFVRDLG